MQLVSLCFYMSPSFLWNFLHAVSFILTDLTLTQKHVRTDVFTERFVFLFHALTLLRCLFLLQAARSPVSVRWSSSVVNKVECAVEKLTLTWYSATLTFCSSLKKHVKSLNTMWEQIPLEILGTMSDLAPAYQPHTQV